MQLIGESHAVQRQLFISSLSDFNEINACVDYSLIGGPFVYRCISTQSTLTERVGIAFDFRQ